MGENTMAINLDKPNKWKADIAQSVDFYNKWFMEYAPCAFRETRTGVAKQVENALIATNNLIDLTPAVLKKYPQVLPILRMSTCPPIAQDRLVGLAGVTKNLVNSMEDSENPRTPPRCEDRILQEQLERICKIIMKMADKDIFVWLNREEIATEQEIGRAATIVADRLCGAVSDPIIRNAQEKRQLAAIGTWLKNKGYRKVEGIKFDKMELGTYSFRTNVPVAISKEAESVNNINIPIDVVIMPISAKSADMPLLIEAKSAGDFTNVNKRRKEEAQKMNQLRSTYGDKVRFGLFLCGYFDSGYLGYEAAEGIDWVWEHRIDDLQQYNL
jgi:hypothetical protein